MRSLVHLGWVFLGGGIGSGLRYGVGRAALALAGPGFPLGTLVVNVLGCTLMGALTEWLTWRDMGIDASMKLFLTTGLLGGFTTFSAFSLETLTLARQGEPGRAALFTIGSFVLCGAGVAAGAWLGARPR